LMITIFIDFNQESKIESIKFLKYLLLSMT